LSPSNTIYVVDNSTNLPYSLDATPVTLQKDGNTILRELTGTSSTSLILTGIVIPTAPIATFNTGSTVGTDLSAALGYPVAVIG